MNHVVQSPREEGGQRVTPAVHLLQLHGLVRKQPLAELIEREVSGPWAVLPVIEGLIYAAYQEIGLDYTDVTHGTVIKTGEQVVADMEK